MQDTMPIDLNRGAPSSSLLLRFPAGVSARATLPVVEMPLLGFIEASFRRFLPQTRETSHRGPALILLLLALAETLLEVFRAKRIQRRVVAGPAGCSEMRTASQALAAAGGPQFGASCRAIVTVAVAWKERKM